MIAYKYRDWGKEYHRKFLQDCEIRFSSPDEFNDLFDVNTVLNFEKINHNKLRKYLQALLLNKKPNLVFDLKTFFNEVERAYNNYVINDKKLLAQDYTNKLRNFVGVFCLSMTNCSIHNWTFYGESNKGFCVGLDLEQINASYKPVKYHKEYPEFEPNLDINSIEDILNLITAKCTVYSNEDEIRLFKPSGQNYILPFSKSAVKEIILGFNISKEHESEIYNLWKTKFSHAKLLRIKPVYRQYQFNVVEYNQTI